MKVWMMPMGDLRKLDTDFYLTGDYNFMFHDSFKLKWGVIGHLVRTFGYIFPWRILDLGCGKITILDYLEKKSVARYVGVDSSEEVIKCRKMVDPAGEYYQADYLNNDLKLGNAGEFNVFTWTGAETNPRDYPKVIMKYWELMIERSLFIFDYANWEPTSIATRLANMKFMRHVTGCRLELPYVPPEIRRKFPNVTTRIIEACRKSFSL